MFKKAYHMGKVGSEIMLKAFISVANFLFSKWAGAPPMTLQG
jgi:hypothetical protein